MSVLSTFFAKTATNWSNGGLPARGAKVNLVKAGRLPWLKE